MEFILKGMIIYCVLLIACYFLANLSACCAFDIMSSLHHLVCLFYLSDNKHRWQMCRINSVIILLWAGLLHNKLFFPQSFWENSSYEQRYGFRRLIITVEKKNVWIPCSQTLSPTSKLCLVFHSRYNNPQLQPADVTVMLLICVRQ